MIEETLTQKFPYFFNLMRQYGQENINLADHVLYHLNMGQGRILNILKEQSPISQKDLVAKLNITPQSASELLQKLEKKALIQREKSQTDKRVTIVSITNKGLVTTQPHDMSLLVFESLTPDEQAQLDHLLTKMIVDLESKVKHQPHDHHH